MPFRSLTGALHGVRVLDLSRVLAGPFCTQILGDLGAEVIKVEQPGEGDETRGWGPPYAGSGADAISSYFLSCNRNKKSIGLDLKAPDAQSLLIELIRRSDILVENFRSDSRAALGLDAKRIHAVNPRLIVCSISGFGANDPARRPGYDYVVQGMSGMMAMNGQPDGDPQKFGVAIADIVTGLYATSAVLAALHARHGSGEGYAIDLALLDCAVAAQANVVQAYLTTGKQPSRQGHGHLQIVPYQLFKASDGYLVLAVGNDRQWRAFCDAAGLVDLRADSRFAKNTDRVRLRAELIPRLETEIGSKPLAEWQRLLTGAKIPHGPVWSFDALFNSEDAKRAGLRITTTSSTGQSVDLVRSPLLPGQHSASMPPKVGEHTDEVLTRLLGTDPARLAALRASGAIA